MSMATCRRSPGDRLVAWHAAPALHQTVGIRRRAQACAGGGLSTVAQARHRYSSKWPWRSKARHWRGRSEYPTSTGFGFRCTWFKLADLAATRVTVFAHGRSPASGTPCLWPHLQQLRSSRRAPGQRRRSSAHGLWGAYRARRPIAPGSTGTVPHGLINDRRTTARGWLLRMGVLLAAGAHSRGRLARLIRWNWRRPALLVHAIHRSSRPGDNIQLEKIYFTGQPSAHSCCGWLFMALHQPRLTAPGRSLVGPFASGSGSFAG